MSYAQDNGYTPRSFSEIMDALRQGINAQFGTSYTAESFVGTNWYKYYYEPAQQIQLNETKTAEIFHKVQQYIALTNEKIQRPSVSAPGLLDSFASKGYVVSVKPPEVGDAGLIFLALLLDNGAPDYAAKKLEVAGLIKDFVAAGIVSQGAESTPIVLSNGQSFDFKFALPDESAIKLRLTLKKSENTLLSQPDDETVRAQLFAAINSRYRLGWNFEPQRYYTLNDAQWAESVLLEYSLDDGGTWLDEVYEANFDEIFTFGLEDIDVVFT